MPANAISTVEGILRVTISSPKMSTPVPPYSHRTWETGIEVYLLEISQTPLRVTCPNHEVVDCFEWDWV